MLALEMSLLFARRSLPSCQLRPRPRPNLDAAGCPRRRRRPRRCESTGSDAVVSSFHGPAVELVAELVAGGAARAVVSCRHRLRGLGKTAQVVTLSPRTPARMSPTQNNLPQAAESPNSKIPRITVPIAPIPVQTA